MQFLENVTSLLVCQIPPIILKNDRKKDGKMVALAVYMVVICYKNHLLIGVSSLFLI